MSSRIHISSDFLATKESEQESNLRWLMDILRRPVEQAAGLQPVELKSFHDADRGFSRINFFQLSGIEVDKFAVHIDFSPSTISAESIQYLSSHVGESDVVIGYELSEATRTILARAGIVYIDIWLHPVRYLDDVLFAFSSSNEDVQRRLHAYNLPTDVYYAYADRLRVQAYRGFRRAKLQLEERSALFVGQTLNDKAISSEGRMLTVLDYKEKFRTLCSAHPVVYYSRHPFVKEGDEEVMAFVKGFRNVRVVEDPTYFLIASPEIVKVCSVSSSVVHEARYFGKETEFYFRPAVIVGDSEDCYSSVYQEFMFGHFWSDVLRGVLPVKSVRKGCYLDGKDKLRDMLSFYWGYRNIDKLESLKQTVGEIVKKNSRVASASGGNVRRLIEEADVVSFDVFDSLVGRNVFFPTDVLAFAEPDARRVTNGKVKNFRQRRLQAEQKLRTEASAAGVSQETTIADIYRELGAIFGLDDHETLALLEIELAAELSRSVRRDAGYYLYAYARRLGKDIIAISDTCHNATFIHRLLKQSGYDGIAKVYVSSEIGLRKHEGDLFDYVLKDTGVKPANMLHIGDNARGDIESAGSRGITTVWLPRSAEGLEQFSDGYKRLVAELRIGKTVFDSTTMATIARRYFDNPIDRPKPKTMFGGDAFNLGYIGLGPAIVGFASWIYQQAKSEGVENIYFLSRDGLVVKNVFDRLYRDCEGYRPKTSYIYASRRAARVASISCWADICEIVEKPIYSTTIGDYLFSRFGVLGESVPRALYEKHGLSGGSQCIGAKFDRDTLAALVYDLKDMILERASIERVNYGKYLAQVGVGAGKAAIVDIGYVGSMQAAFKKLLGTDLLGLYFATFAGAREELEAPRLVRGYTVQFGSPKGNEHTIQTHRFVYESLFCADHDTFVCMEYDRENETLLPTFRSDSGDEQRRRVVAQAHAGAELFAEEIRASIDFTSLEVEAKAATRILDIWLRHPCIDDALIVEGVVFEDSTGPSIRRYLVPPRELIGREDVQAQAIWTEGLRAVMRMKSVRSKTIDAEPVSGGAAALTSSTKVERRGGGRALLRLERWFIKRVCSEKKTRKYYRDREGFFVDSRSPLIRWYAQRFVFSR